MVPIYIKLGSALSYDNERLDFHLDSEVTAGILDYNNLNEEIYRDLSAGLIIQIDAAEYYSIGGGPMPPIYIDPGGLITLVHFLPPCPADSAIFFAYTGGKWYKVLWSTIKSCIGVGSGIKFRFFVQDPKELSWHPAEGDTTFINTGLIGKTSEKLLVTLNGVELYPKSTYPVSEQGNYNWYTVNEITDNGEMSVNVPYANKDVLSVKEI